MKKMKFLLFVAVLVAVFSCKRTEEVAPVNAEPTGIQPNDSLVTQDVPGVPVVIAGSFNHTGAANGTGTGARFHSPMGIFVKSDGSLLVADNQNRAIRRISTANVVSTPYHIINYPTDVAAIKDGAVGVVSDFDVTVFNHGTHVTRTAGCSHCQFAGIDKNPGSTFFWVGGTAGGYGFSSWLESINELAARPVPTIGISDAGDYTDPAAIDFVSFSVAANDNKFLVTFNQVFECTHSGVIFNLIPGYPFSNLTSIVANHDGSKLYIAEKGVIRLINRCSICKIPTVTTLFKTADAYGLALSNDEKVLYFTSMVHHTVNRVILP